MKVVMDERQKVFSDFEVPDPPRIRKVANFIRGYFEKIEGLTLLECGVAKGGVADLLSKEGAICYGIDVNPRSLLAVKIIQCDLNQGLPNFDQKFDVIFAGELIEHLYDDVAFVNKCNNYFEQMVS